MDPKESGAFVEVCTIAPTGSGILDTLTFAVKDLMDVAGRVTGCGNPTWLATHSPATAHAVCVDQLLAAGATCKGRVLTDELAFSLIGENHFYGTPLNPKAPDRVCGGSSCGSASSVACGLVDFALGTDTGGSVRVPAANCGIWGLRPTHGRISLAGVNPLAPTFDTVGILASDLNVLTRAAAVLLSLPLQEETEPHTIHLITEAFDLCDPEVRTAIQEPLQRLQTLCGSRMRWTSAREIVEESTASSLDNWREIYRVLIWAEAESCLGAWVAAAKPEFGPIIRQNFEMIRTMDRSTVGKAIERRENYFRRVNSFLTSSDLLCIPTIPSPAPLKGTIRQREQSGPGYYPRTLSLTSLAGVARLPQVTLPLANISGIPLGLSLLARNGEDAFLLASAGMLASHWSF